MFSPYVCTWWVFVLRQSGVHSHSLLIAGELASPVRGLWKRDSLLPENGQSVEEANALDESVYIFLAMQVNVDYNLSRS